jgi:dolichol-phosphate mannosyltransferase
MSEASNPSGLTVVIPAYNEEALVASVVGAWVAELERLGIDYEIRVYDDGSRDRTGTILEDLARENPRIVATRQANRGHGPTIVRGYREAASDWILQVDADGELGPDGFEQFWRSRAPYDFLVGSREQRHTPLARRLLSFGSRAAVRLLFGSGILDVNSGFRLMRREAIRPFLPWVGETFAPNVILSGLAIRTGLRTHEAPIQFRPRSAGTVSISGLKVWRTAARSMKETVAIALRYRNNERP